MNFKEIYLVRRSNRFLNDQLVTKDQILSILDAGQHAPVAKGQYDDLAFYVIEGETFKKFKDELAKNNLDSILFNSGLVFLVLHKGSSTVLKNQDVGSVTENMALEAASLGLGSVYSYTIPRIIGNNPTYKNILGLEDYSEYEILSALVVGHKASDEVRNIEHKIKVLNKDF